MSRCKIIASGLLGAMLLFLAGCAKSSGSDPVPTSVAKVLNHSTGQAVGQVVYNPDSSDLIDIRASDYAGVDKNHIIVRKAGLGSIIAKNLTSGNVQVPPSFLSGAEIFVLNGGTDYTIVERGHLRLGRTPTWSWANDAQGYIPTAEQISFVENISDEFNAILNSVPGLPYGSFTKTSNNGTIKQIWYNTNGGPYAHRAGTTICYNAFSLGHDLVRIRRAVYEELIEDFIALDDFTLGGEPGDVLCDSAGNPIQSYKDLLFYVFVKE